MITARALVISGTFLTSVYGGDGSDAATAPAQSPATYRVAIEDMQFRPAQVSVHAGDRIVFSNKDLFPHNVTADAKSFDSLDIAANAAWTYRATKPGTYPYHCAYHPTMQGEIIVK
jgi:plastocyanin